MNHPAKRTFFLSLFLVSAFFPGCDKDSDAGACPDAKCANYGSQAEAQAAYDAAPDCMDALDNDNDKIACEELASKGGGGTGSGSNCPTTSNCGCSGKNKDQCGGNCCQWTVGQGCGCR